MTISRSRHRGSFFETRRSSKCGIRDVDDHVGIRGDARYFRSLQDPERDNEFDIAVGNFDFWLATGGVTFRF